ncbi:MAG: hypothetical protein KJ941_07215 [Bacteroidetes bacterium]|nr:hypothetical protein [Bacteroidota bacterium]
MKIEMMTGKIIALVVLLTSTSFYQARSINDVLTQKEEKKQVYRLNEGVDAVLVIGMGFANFDPISTTDKNKLKKAIVFEVELVYTDFPKGADLSELNKQRILTALTLRSDLVKNESIKWRLIRQMSCESEAEAKVLFHGIVIHYRSEQGEEVMERDFNFLSETLPEKPTETDIIRLRKETKDSTIYKVLERKVNWSGMTVVADVTGSMTPYYTQLVIWFQLNLNDKRIQNVVLFNDGNDKKTEDKKIGSTGGIYTLTPKNYDEFRIQLIETMKKGSGGDSPENDFEALIHAIKDCPKSKEIVLIADNLADVKDFELLEKIDRPIHVILCGVKFGVNPQYIDLAIKTKGSVHTMTQDLEDLYLLSEGKTFTIEKKIFRILGGKAVEVKKT